MAKAICEVCSAEYGDKAMSNHAKDTFTYLDNESGTHTKKNECCGTVVLDSEAHTYGTNDKCVCGADIPTYTVSVENGMISCDCVCTSTVVNENGSVTVTANTAPEGQQFVGWSVGGEIVSTDVNYTFNAVGNVTITAVYEAVEVIVGEGEPEGLSGGAIAGIVIACVVVLAGAGFAVYWFVFRKKKINNI